MTFFEVLPSDAPTFNATLDGVSRWTLPSIDCSVCGGHGGMGEHYPTVDLSDWSEREHLEEPRSLQAVSLEEYQRLHALLRPRVPAGAPLEPGTQLGPIDARSSGRFGDIYFQEPWQPWMTRSALERLQSRKLLGLQGARGNLRHRGASTPLELLTLEIQVRGELHPSCRPPDWRPPCPRCGSYRNGYPMEASVLDANTLPKDVDLFRLREFKTVIIASARFVEAVNDLALRDIQFRELPSR
ncbi:double-CXXCG motif protein [Myxococcus sp. AS-1-15]|uniref:SitI6 family double-CXXCG motif immunity protein n=1 Tax=Myxococcus sp. AS-1-15 TaxID=2874600 RepID=UPI001CBF1173|nr:double-CXXCG motif protein [Myxococcus sp. AS-1-15]MBZ4395270.1 double-CXXCG motif protein [Myxococcus sp. AS-1-15]